MSTEEKLEEFCRSLASFLHVGVFVTSRDGTILFMNKAFEAMFGFDCREAIGVNICNYFPGSELLNVIRSGREQVRVPFLFKGVEAFISRYPIFDGEECIGGYVEAYVRDIQELQPLLSRIQELERRSRYFESRLKATQPHVAFTFDDIVGGSEVMRQLRTQGRRFATSNQPVLITGESGTGKELIASSLHTASLRASQPFVGVNCAAIPTELMEAELFGYVGGAFTGANPRGRIGKFELADGGTIFLDEVCEIPLPIQAKLLRVLETREIQKIGSSENIYSDFRVLAATNKDLGEMAAEGKFRLDLYHRLSILHLHAPPLRERFDDLPSLVSVLLGQICEQERFPVPGVDGSLFAALQKYHWPGNVRELKNVLIYALFAREDREAGITGRSLPPHFLDASMASEAEGGGSLKRHLRRYTRLVVERTLLQCGGNRVRAARELGISRNEVYNKIRQLGIDPNLGR